MGKLALVLVAAAVLYGAHQTTSSKQGQFAAARQTATEEYRLIARSAAKAGFTRTRQALVQRFQSGVVEGTFDGSAYTTTARVEGDTVAVISSNARIAGPEGRPVTYAIAARITRRPGSTGSGGGSLAPVPSYMRYAFLAGGNVNIGGSIDIGVTDNRRDTLNALVHANGRLTLSGGAARIRGFATYGTTFSGRTSVFQPYNPRGLPVVAQGPPIVIPPIVPDQVAAAFGGADRTYGLNGTSASLSGNLPGGTRENPMVYRLVGQASLTNVRVNGYAVFIADAGVSVGGRLEGYPYGYNGPQESTVAIYTPGRVSMGGNTVAWAQIVASSASYAGTVDIYGNLVTQQGINLTGSFALHYRPASPGLTQGLPGGGGTEPSLVVVAYREG